MRVFGIARQSRGDDNSKSVAEQEERLRDWCEREGHELVHLVAEQDVSGGRPLAKRPGLNAAVEAIEAGEVDTIAVVYFDRLVRSLKVQAEVAERTERAGGRIVALDVGEVSQGTAAQWLNASILGVLAEHTRRVTSERVKSAHERLAREGKWRGGKVPIGLRLEDGRVVAGDHAAAILAAYRMRKAGSSLTDIRDYLRDATGQEIRSLNIVQRALRNPAYVEAGVVPADLHRRVRALRLPRGRRPPSDQLLARLGVLRCASCGAKMVSATSTGSGGRRVPTYRCPPNGACADRQAITASIADEAVVDAVKSMLRDIEGRADLGDEIEAARNAADNAADALDAAVAAFDGIDAASARERLLELQDARDSALDHLAELEAAQKPARTIRADADWHLLTVDERRALIRAVVEEATVSPGRGADRITVKAR